MNKSINLKAVIVWISGILFISALFITIWSGLRYLTDDEDNPTRVQMHEFYAQENLDTLLMGASHCYAALDPADLDQKLGWKCFNLGSALQPIDVTWLLMQEAVERYDIRRIFVDLSYNIAMQTLTDPDEYIGTYLITDYLKPSFRRAAFLLRKSGEGNYVNSFLPARRYRETLYHFKDVRSLLEIKQSPAYKSYAYPENTSYQYLGKGFMGLKGSVQEGSFFDSSSEYSPQLDLKAIDPEWRMYIQQMIHFCDAHDIELTFISTPISSYKIMRYGDYDLFINHIREIIEESGHKVSYLDFNLLKEACWENTSLAFYDGSHLNRFGAEQFTELFSAVMRGDYDETELFYPSVKEKYKALDPAFYGLARGNEENGETEYLLIANHPERLQYRVFSDEEGQKSTLLIGWSEDPVFHLPSDFEGTCRIQVSADGNRNDIKEYILDLGQSYLTAE